LDGSDEDVGSSADVQLEALMCLLTEALQADAAIAGGPVAAERRVSRDYGSDGDSRCRNGA
jgi:hypothetical protein